MSKQEQAQQYAAIIRHNRDAKENLRSALSDMFKRGQTESYRYKALKQQHDLAQRNDDKYTQLLGELNARVLPDGTLEIYK